MTTSRRVKKGPGRRPQSAKRARFMQLRALGWGVRRAAREVGASSTAGHNWARGHLVYRKGKVVGSVPPLDRLEAREISPRFLSQNERIEIADLHQQGVTIRAIAGQLGRAPSTISRELRRNAHPIGKRCEYGPFEAHRRAVARRARSHRRRVETNTDLRGVLEDCLAQRWSPQQISRHLRHKYPKDRSMWLCHESIYQAIYQPGSTLTRGSPLAPHRTSPLRTGRDHRRAQLKPDRRRPRFQRPMLTIHQRPFDPQDRSQAGAWEGDLIIGANNASAIGTMVERQTRLLRLLHLPIRDGGALHHALMTRMGSLPGGLFRSITWDQGTEMARHATITKPLGAPVYLGLLHE